LLDRRENAGLEGSGNPQGIFYTKLSHRKEALAEYALQSYQYACRAYRELPSKLPLGEWVGLLQLSESDKDLELQKKVGERFAQYPDLVELVDQARASSIAGVDVTKGGLWFPQGGWVIPPNGCRALAEHPCIERRYNFELNDLTATTTGWKLNDELEVAHVVIACAHSANKLEQLKHLNTRIIRGQIDRVEHSAGHFKTAITGDGYIVATDATTAVCGASFVIDDSEQAERASETQENLDRIAALSTSFAHAKSYETRVNFRCTSPDYLPMVGPVADVAKTCEAFAPLSKNKRSDIPLPGIHQAGLWVNVAMGSKGISYSPLAAELLASLMCKTLLPVSKQLADALNPNRFVMRDIIRGKI